MSYATVGIVFFFVLIGLCMVSINVDAKQCTTEQPCTPACESRKAKRPHYRLLYVNAGHARYLDVNQQGRSFSVVSHRREQPNDLARAIHASIN